MDTIYISVIDDKSIKLEINDSTKIIHHEQTLTDLFNRLANEKITKYRVFKNGMTSSIYFGDIRCHILDYQTIRNMTAFEKLNKKINLYKAKVLASKILNKKVIVIGSVVGAVIFTNVVAASNDNTPINVLEEEQNISIETEKIDIKDKIFNIALDENNYDWNSITPVETSKEINEDNDIDPLTSMKEVDEGINPITKNNEETQIQEVDETINNDTKENKNIQNQETIDTSTFDNPIYNSNTDYTNFESLKNFTSYDKYIKFAAALYGVDLDVATKQVKENYENFMAPGKPVNEHAANELDRMKDLVSRGFINGDMNVIGIFLTIKDYAIDYMNLSEQPAIHSDKTPEQREKEVVEIAKYIYGVDDNYLLSLMVATMRVESNSGLSKAATNKNNIGGNMSSKGTFENPVLNTYKTAEIGEESFVRNFLNCYGKSLVAHNYDTTIPIPIVMKDKFCPHTPDEWAKVITEKVDTIMESGIVDEYITGDIKRL